MQLRLPFAVAPRAGTVLAVNAAVLVGVFVALASVVHAQTDFDTNGATIGVVDGNARVGFNTPSPTP